MRIDKLPKRVDQRLQGAKGAGNQQFLTQFSTDFRKFRCVEIALKKMSSFWGLIKVFDSLSSSWPLYVPDCCFKCLQIEHIAFIQIWVYLLRRQDMKPPPRSQQYRSIVWVELQPLSRTTSFSRFSQFTWYAHATSRKSVIRVHPSIQCHFTHFCPSDALESTQIGPKLSEKLSSLWWERKWRSRVMQAPIDCFRKLINFSQYIMTRKLSKTPQKCSTKKVRRIPPASLTGISLIPSETCFRPVREAGYEPTLKLPLQERTIV